MIILGIFIFLVIVYFSIVFLLSRMIVPHLGFIDDKIPELIPASLLEKIEELKKTSNNQEEFLKSAHEFIGSRYRSERMNTFLKLNYLFKKADAVWNMEGYIPCTQSNFLLRILLVKSGFFKEDEIRRRHNMVNFCLHQYLQVKIDDKWLDVDVGEKQRGMQIGRHLKYFG